MTTHNNDFYLLVNYNFDGLLSDTMVNAWNNKRKSLDKSFIPEKWTFNTYRL